MVVNGKTVCPSAIDNRFSLTHIGERDYRDDSETCSLHVTVNKATGQVANTHIDEYNPQFHLLEHLFLDVIPDRVLTFLPPGRDLCP